MEYLYHTFVDGGHGFGVIFPRDGGDAGAGDLLPLAAGAGDPLPRLKPLEVHHAGMGRPHGHLRERFRLNGFQQTAYVDHAYGP